MDSAKHRAANPSAGSSGVSEQDDADLVAAVLRGDAARSEELVVRLRCVPRFLAALNAQYGRIVNEHDLADIAQETLLLIWRKLPTFVGPSSLEGWAYGIAHREFLHARRTRMRHGSRQRPLPETFDLIEETEEDPELDLHVVDALFQLDPEEREVLGIRHERGLTFAEIGAELGVPENTAKTRYRRALLHLRELVRQSRRREEHET